ncbi:hypothetical protein PI124_g23504 [Phytophthora idaei]|nr:hypothetical protein PI125_g25618 [Phytophthora idaei]KAG3123772.1 hypothetical protein PI126_g23554 [Phytophthora idaei]KAG3231400.1 hypothetical protein PI124_g23504 [Phytophthora idaei]
MRLAYVLLLAVCIAITACDALSAFGDYGYEAAAMQNAKLRGMPDKRLLRSDNFAHENDAVDAEERGIPGLLKLKEFAKTEKNNDRLHKYASLVAKGYSDDAIFKTWMKETKDLDRVYNSWFRLRKSDKDTSELMFKNGVSPENLYRILDKRGVGMDGMYKLWRDLGLDERRIYNIWVTGEKKKTSGEIYEVWYKAGKNKRDILSLLGVNQRNVDTNYNRGFWLGYN